MDSKPLYLSFDVGGTTIKYALLSNDNKLYEYHSVPTNKNYDSHILTTLKQVCIDLMKCYNIHAIGVSTAGIVDTTLGEIKYANPLIPNYTGTKIKATLEEATDLPVSVINDVQAALLGEVWQQQLPPKTFCLTLGTGIGGAFLNHEDLYVGAHNYENSIGYLNYDKNTDTYWEQRASTIALEKQLTKNFNVSVPEAFDYARSGQDVFVTIIDEWINEIAKGISSIVLLFDPHTILIGGGVSKQNDYILPILTEKVNALLPPDFLSVSFKTPSSFNNNALIGAVYPFLNPKKEANLR